jgi:hypothetical protein
MKKYCILSVIFIAAFACRERDKSAHETEPFFPVLSYIKSQVAHVDTSFYPVIKITRLDSTHQDTVYVKREEFSNLAKDFLEIPDLSEKKYISLYTEEKFYDEGLNRVVFTYKPVNPEAAIIQRQEVLITPDPSGDKVKSIYIDLSIINKDSSVQKKMLWQVDQRFQVATIIQKPGQPETSSVIKVVWNEKNDE